VVAATAFQLFTLGIPCIYYGSEQAFAGPTHSQLPFLLAEGWNDGGNHGDRFLREAMFGPDHPRARHDQDLATQIRETDATLPGFGPFGTFGAHAFDPSSPAYRRIAALCAARAAHPALRIGRQYPRQTRVFGPDFRFPSSGELVAWSRLLDTTEALVVVNPNGEAARGGDVVVSAELWAPGDEFEVVANSAQAAVASAAFTGPHSVGSRVQVGGRQHAAEPAFVSVDPIGPAEVIVFMAIAS